jgi:hypothetical protein
VGCDRCHTDKNPLLDFIALGYTRGEAEDLEIPR